MIDLHTHSTFSDGTLTPEELIRLAECKNIKMLALTDHDTVNGIDNFLSVDTHIIKIPGVEISIDYNPGTFHLVGLLINHKNEKLKNTLDKLIEYRKERNKKLLKLIEKHFNLKVDEKELKSNTDGELGRPHIAKFLVDKGVVKTTQEAFDKYLGKGCPLYIAKKRLKIDEAIEIIHSANGIAIMAHPISLNLNNDEYEPFLKKLKDIGLDGIEVFCSLHTEDDAKLFLEIAKKYNFLISAGSDFHGINKFGIDIGSTGCPADFQKEIFDNFLKLVRG
ncbi:PHP domain-containing protein [Deferribacter thermophilus]|uniref:PHP domain-containing protein n=1 Tax=Deferribacter thermophilus TaxID=53573 RepID=UPI003C259A69